MERLPKGLYSPEFRAEAVKLAEVKPERDLRESLRRISRRSCGEIRPD